MLIKRTWITNKVEKQSYHTYTVSRKFYGYFLFGFIPLYIVNFDTKYVDSR